MEWLRKIKSGAVFVDLLLVLGAIIAIIGLGIFVRMREGVPVNAPTKTPTLPLTSQHIPTVSEEIEVTEDTATPPVETTPAQIVPNVVVTPEPTTAPITKPIENIVTPIINKIVKPACDEIQKLQLLSNYNAATNEEDTSYQNALDNAKTSLNDLLTPITDGLDGLLDAHTSRLSSLKTELLSNLSHINCTL